MFQWCTTRKQNLWLIWVWTFCFSGEAARACQTDIFCLEISNVTLHHLTLMLRSCSFLFILGTVRKFGCFGKTLLPPTQAFFCLQDGSSWAQLPQALTGKDTCSCPVTCASWATHRPVMRCVHRPLWCLIYQASRMLAIPGPFKLSLSKLWF